MRDEYKYVSWRSIKPGDTIKEIKRGNCTMWGSYEITEANMSFVRYKVYGGIEESVDSDGAMFGIPMSEAELKNKYENPARQVVEALKNRMAEYEIGVHEMWNGWLSIDPYELAQSCSKHHMTVIGYCTEITPKNSMFFDDIFDCAIVAMSEEDGEKFWCHWKEEWRQHLIEKWEEEHNV